MGDPAITIVTPSFNQGRFIRATIESVLSQDYSNLEYIIMDGGSTDETASVVKDYASRLTFISEKDRGQSHAINKGFQMAKGDIVAWLNSDDLYLPGCVRTAVNALNASPAAGAVYGEGYLIDREGRTTSRFPCTEPFDLWKLTWLSDYILQQTVYFRKMALDEVGLLNEDLHFTMDWDILIRIGKRWPLEFIPEYLGCLREYPEAKSSAGGLRRAREIRQMLQRHTGRRISPGAVIYGLDTVHQLLCAKIARILPGALSPVTNFLHKAIRVTAGPVIGHTIKHSQGLYSDGWAGARLHYMLPPGEGSIVITGELPEWDWFYGQRIHVYANDRLLAGFNPPFGDFELRVKLPEDLRGKAVNITIEATMTFMPGRLTLRGDRRQLAFLLKSIRWEDGFSLFNADTERMRAANR